MPNNFKIQCVPKHFSWKSNISQGDLREEKKEFMSIKFGKHLQCCSFIVPI